MFKIVKMFTAFTTFNTLTALNIFQRIGCHEPRVTEIVKGKFWWKASVWSRFRPDTASGTAAF